LSRSITERPTVSGPEANTDETEISNRQFQFPLTKIKTEAGRNH